MCVRRWLIAVKSSKVDKPQNLPQPKSYICLDSHNAWGQGPVHPLGAGNLLPGMVKFVWTVDKWQLGSPLGDPSVKLP